VRSVIATDKRGPVERESKLAFGDFKDVFDHPGRFEAQKEEGWGIITRPGSEP
jgi:hypothetical protein